MTQYPHPVNKLLTLGDPRNHKEWLDPAALGLTLDHVPDIIQVMLDEDLISASSESKEVWAPLHAWRALGQLRAESAIESLIQVLGDNEDGDDDWAPSELPEVFGKIGAAAIPALAAYLAQPQHEEYSRGHAASSLREIVQQHPATRAEIVNLLTQQLARHNTKEKIVNGCVLAELLDLKAVEALPVIEKAFAAKCIQEYVAGDWEDVQIEFGLKTKRDHPPTYDVMRDVMGLKSDQIDFLQSIFAEDDPNEDDDLFLDRKAAQMSFQAQMMKAAQNKKPEPKKKKK